MSAREQEPSSDKKLEQNKQEKPLSFIGMVIATGFTGGILWSGIAYICYMFSFTKLEPNIILEPWAVGDWKETWLGIVISILAYGLVSIGVALVYYALLRKLKSMWVGAGYGIALMLIVFVVLNPLFPSMKGLGDTDYITLITEACLYILYGVFIGYSISYEENELRHHHEKEEQVSQ
ncbi:YqhR family membrane protein [Bacillus salacetis]|uniref:YqhR family membrane protein n=1 Tax=Bacillus salacetis TaxID=2315464 RepID=UPI003B9F8F07